MFSLCTRFWDLNYGTNASYTIDSKIGFLYLRLKNNFHSLSRWLKGQLYMPHHMWHVMPCHHEWYIIIWHVISIRSIFRTRFFWATILTNTLISKSNLPIWIKLMGLISLEFSQYKNLKLINSRHRFTLRKIQR